MKDMKLAEKINEQRSLILWAELAGLLHDIGKLSNAFYDYRQKWKIMPDGLNKDPHDHEFIDKYDKLIVDFPSLKRIFEEIPNFIKMTSYKLAENCTIKKFVHTHIKPQDELVKLLSAADGTDAAQDRNNPLFTSEQIGQIFDTDVFGSEFEKRKFTPDTADSHRKELYSNLEKILPEYLKNYQYERREEVLNIIREILDKAFSDTARPDNDTSLWEHCYAVASIFKTLIVHNVIYNEKLDEFQKVHFGIMGVGWDGLSFISCGHKIGDIIGRQETLEALKEKIKQLFEYHYLLGNCIYEDINGIFFLIPSLPEHIDFENFEFHNLNEYGKLLQELRADVINISIEKTRGDLYPQFKFIQDTKFMTQIVRCINEIKRKTIFPLIAPNEKIQKEFQENWKKAFGATICPVCRKRPIEEKWEICNICNERRKRVYGKRSEDKITQTPFIREITIANKQRELKKRAALIVAKFGLDNWLNGKMIRSLFITEAKGLEKELDNLGNIKSFETEEKKAKQWLETSPFGNLVKSGYDYSRIKKEVNFCYNFDTLQDNNKKEYAKSILFLYGRRHKFVDGKKENIYIKNFKEVRENWNRWLESTIEECNLYGKLTEGLLENILCTKTPTPSTILDVWNTTKKFFESISEEKNGRLLWTEKKVRFKADIPKPNGKNPIIGFAYEGRIKKEDIEVLWLKEEDDSALIIGREYDKTKIKNWINSTIILKGKPFGEKGNIVTGQIKSLMPDNYYPIRIVATTPDIFLAIVPADRTVEITENIYSEYIKQFGKVMGRLPLSIGNIFFEEKTPMFVILDSARRMIQNFERLAQKPVELRISKYHKRNTEDIENEKRLVIKLDQIKFGSFGPLERELEWILPYKLGDGNTDYYHPYFILKKGSEDYSLRKNYFWTVIGDVIHFTEVEPGDVLELFPNYYDYEFLDTSIRRHDIPLDKRDRRISNNKFLSKPYLLDELSQGLRGLWDSIRDNGNSSLMPGLTDTKLRNIESLWLSKLQDWAVNTEDRNSEGFKAWAELVEATLKKEFLKYKELDDPSFMKNFERLKETIFSGLFFDCLELNLRILKKRVKEG